MPSLFTEFMTVSLWVTNWFQTHIFLLGKWAELRVSSLITQWEHTIPLLTWNRLGTVFYTGFDMKSSHVVCWSTSLNFPMHLWKWASCVFHSGDLRVVRSSGFWTSCFFFLTQTLFFVCASLWCNTFQEKPNRFMLEELHESKYKVPVRVFQGSAVYATPLLTNYKVISQWAYLSVEKKSTLLWHWSCDSLQLCPQAKGRPLFYLLTLMKEAVTFAYTFCCSPIETVYNPLF